MVKPPTDGFWTSVANLNQRFECHIDKKTSKNTFGKNMDFPEWLLKAYTAPVEASGEWNESSFSYNGGLYYENSTTPPVPFAPPADLNLDPTLTMSNIPTTNAAGSTGPTVGTAPSHLVEAGRQILMSLLQVLDAPDETFTSEQPAVEPETEDLESLSEETHDPLLPRTINDIRVTSNPRSSQIEHIIDCRRMGSKRQVYYLAKTVHGNYYWFCCPRTDRDLKLNKVIGDYQYRKKAKKVRVVRKLRGKTIET